MFAISFAAAFRHIAVNEVRTGQHGNQMEFLEHDNDEPKIDRKFPAPWKLLFLILAVTWAGYLYAFKFDWTSIALGGFSGMVLALWAIEVTGNKVPDSWRSKSGR